MKRDEIVLELDLQGAADAVVRFRTRLDEEARKIRMMEDYAECGIGGILHNIGALRRAGIPNPGHYPRGGVGSVGAVADDLRVTEIEDPDLSGRPENPPDLRDAGRRRHCPRSASCSGERSARRGRRPPRR
jgi:hypothetical protein